MEIDNNSVGSLKHRKGVAANMLDISTETIRYWRSNLDPEKTRYYFSPEDIFVYRIMKSFIRGYTKPISLLKKCDWTLIFKVCNETEYRVLRKHLVILNSIQKKLYFALEDQAPDRFDSNFTAIHLGRIYKQHLKSQIENGLQKNNVIELNTVKSIVL